MIKNIGDISMQSSKVMGLGTVCFIVINKLIMIIIKAILKTVWKMGKENKLYSNKNILHQS